MGLCGRRDAVLRKGGEYVYEGVRNVLVSLSADFPVVHTHHRYFIVSLNPTDALREVARNASESHCFHYFLFAHILRHGRLPAAADGARR